MNFQLYDIVALFNDQIESCFRDINSYKMGKTHKFHKRFTRVKFIYDFNKNIVKNKNIKRIPQELYTFSKLLGTLNIEKPLNLSLLKDENARIVHSDNGIQIWNNADYKTKKKINDSITNQLNAGNPFYKITSRYLAKIIKKMRERSNTFKYWHDTGLIKVLMKGSTSYNLLLKKLLVDNNVPPHISNKYRADINRLFTDGDNDTEFIVSGDITKDQYKKIFKKVNYLLSTIMAGDIKHKLFNKLKNRVKNEITIPINPMMTFETVYSKSYNVHVSKDKIINVNYIPSIEEYLYFSSIDVKIDEHRRFQLHRYKIAYNCVNNWDISKIKFSGEILDIVIAHPKTYECNKKKYDTITMGDITKIM